VFEDSMQGVVWTAPKAALVDGASIPKIFWSLLSGPYEGLYRDASVNHDYETCVKERPWRKVHRMFYYAIRAQGETPARAKLMYLAVWHFGPRWPQKGFTAENDPEMKAPRAQMTEADARRAQVVLEREPDITLEEIEQFDAASIRGRFATFAPGTADMKGLTDGKLIPLGVSDPPCVAN